MDASFVRSVFDEPSRRFAVELWDGEVLEPRAPAAAGRVILRDPDVVELLIPPVSEREIAEAFMEGRIDIEGDGVALIEAAARWKGPRIRARLIAPVVRAWLHRGKHTAAARLRARRSGHRHSIRRDRRMVRHHYDLSDSFYRLFLDPEMVYSSAYFPSGRESLEAAQRAKLDLICAKLGLRPGERFLDVGCGWGALIAHAARNYGASAVGLTVSENQAAEAARRAKSLDGVRPEVQLCDYREFRAGSPFDKIASIGMMEHVGHARLDEYFARLFRLLRPGGLLLNSAIASTTNENTLPWASKRRGGFIDEYIFPDGEMPPIGDVMGAAERAGFEVRDVESLREHYARTVTLWLDRLEFNFDRAVRLVGRERARAFRLYLMSSAAAFHLGRIDVFHVLLARGEADGRRPRSPQSRTDRYLRHDDHETA